MAQIDLPFMPVAAAAATLEATRPFARIDAQALPDPAAADSLDSIGFEIGRDHAHYALTPPLAHLSIGNPVRQGWDAGRASFGRRTLRATPAVRQWLQLRVSAWQRGRVFEGVQVTPHFLAHLGATHCPVTREPLTHGTGADSDASIDRINNRAGYAAGNLALMSARAHRAKAGYGWDEALGFVRQIEAGRLGAIDGLGAAEWARLALLMSFVTPLDHEAAACLPLLVLPPNRLRVLNPVQALQVVLTRLFTAPGYARRLLGLALLMPCETTRRAFRIFMHTLLARRLAAGAQIGELQARQALEDSWRDPLVNRRWQALALRLSAAQCDGIVERAARRGLVPAGSRRLALEAATEGWSLETGGYVVSSEGGCGAGSRTPGSARSFGSQKLAN